MASYLRQLVTGTIYIRTPELAARPDMVPYDEETALKRIRLLQKENEERRARLAATSDNLTAEQSDRAAKISKALAELEASAAKLDELEKAAMAPDTLTEKEIVEQKQALTTQKEIEDQEKKDMISADPQVQAIRKMTSKLQVQEYMLREFGKEVDRNMKLTDLKSLAENARVLRLGEAEG